MVRCGSKERTQAKKELAKVRRALEREKDTIYWLVFIPKTDTRTAEEKTNTWKDPWRIRLSGNPQRDPQLIERAIREFERKFNVHTWSEVAIRYEPDELYYP